VIDSTNESYQVKRPSSSPSRRPTPWGVYPVVLTAGDVKAFLQGSGRINPII